MEKDRKFRALAIAAICVAVVGVSVAYAALTASLTITGTATVNTDASWDVTAANLSCTASGLANFGMTDGESPTPITTKTFNIVSDNIAWDATFNAPGDKVVCTTTWTNNGSIDAAVTALQKGVSGDLENNFSYDVVMGTTALTTTAVTENHYYLKANTSKNVTITVILDPNSELNDMTSVAGKTAEFTANFEFKQAQSGNTYNEL